MTKKDVIPFDIQYVSIADIDTDEQYQPRTKVTNLKELTESIKTHGQKTPAIVFRNGQRFMLVGGHRRLAALRSLKVNQMLCLVYESEEPALDALLDNCNRENLSDGDVATYIQQRLLDVPSDKLAAAIGFKSDVMEQVTAGMRVSTENETPQLSFETLELLGKFEGDDEAVEEILNQHTEHMMIITAQRIIANREIEIDKAKAKAEAEAAGIVWLENAPQYGTWTQSTNDGNITLDKPCGCDGMRAWWGWNGASYGCIKKENHPDNRSEQERKEQEERNKRQELFEVAQKSRIEFINKLALLSNKELAKLSIIETAWQRLIQLNEYNPFVYAGEFFDTSIEMCDISPNYLDRVLLATSGWAESELITRHGYLSCTHEEAQQLFNYYAGLEQAGYQRTEGDKITFQYIEDKLLEEDN